MAQAVGHERFVGAPRHRASGRGTAPGPVHVGWVALGAWAVGYVGAAMLLAAADDHWPDWVGAAVFSLWFVVGVAWADAVRAHWHWAVSVVVGLALLVAASVLPSTHTPPEDAWAWAVAVCASLGTGFTLGPAVAAVLARVRR